MMSAVAAEAASDLVRKVYPVCTADANAVWSCSFGALGASRASSPGASGWCGCIRPVQSSENTVMEHLPQRGDVIILTPFHTPRLRNKPRAVSLVKGFGLTPVVFPTGGRRIARFRLLVGYGLSCR